MRGYSPLHYIAAVGNQQTMSKWLEDHNVDIDVREPKEGLTPLMFAVLNQQNKMAMMLVEQTANPNMKDFHGRTSLYIAVQNNNLEMAIFLVENGASPNLSDIEDVSPLHTAAAMGNEQMVRALVQRGAWVNLRDNQGETPLFYAIREGRHQITKTLVEFGADISCVNIDGENVLDFALSIGDQATVQYLSSIKQNPNLNRNSFPQTVICGMQMYVCPPMTMNNGKLASSPGSLADGFASLSLEKRNGTVPEQTLLNKWVVW